MAEISRLIEIVKSGRREDLRSDSAQPGLERLLAVLSTGFERWTSDQVDAVVSLSSTILTFVHSSSVEVVEPLVLAIMERSLEFCLLFLEKSNFEGDDLSLQNQLVRFLELSLISGASKESMEIAPLSIITERFLSIPNIKPFSFDLVNKNSCYLQGFNCSKEENVSGKLLTTLASEFSQPFSVSFSDSGQPGEPPLLTSSPDMLMSAAQHFAVIHLNCLPRLLTLCREHLRPPVYLEKTEEMNLTLRLSLIQRILKLLKILAGEFLQDGSDIELLWSVARFTNSLHDLFKSRFDLGSHDGLSFADSLGALLLSTVDEFLQLVRVTVYNVDMYGTVQACIAGSIMEIFSSNIWRYEKPSLSLKPPLAYSPRVVRYMLKLIADVRKWVLQSDFKETASGLGVADVVCRARSEKISLLKKYTYEEYLRLIFPPSEQWVDDLVHLAFFLHVMAVKSVTAVEKSRTSFTKPSVVSDTDSVVSHDEEAIFGDLFAEASRPDQPDTLSSTNNNSSSSTSSTAPCLPVQVTADLLTFMKTCVFSPEWNRNIYENALAKINSGHINRLLSILNCQATLCIEKPLDNQNSLNESCFELLQSLLVGWDLPVSLKEDLIDQVLKTENGMYSYNHYTLALVAHSLILGANSVASNLRAKLFTGFLDIVIDRANGSLTLTESADFLNSLPCAFHIEILLMSFHLSSMKDKETLAKLVFSSLKKSAVTPPPVTELTRWGLLVSRVFLLLRHMVLYPSGCPSWLLARFRSKLREIPFKPAQSSCIHDHLPSLASAVLEGIFGNSLKESPLTSGLLPQLIDVVPLHTSVKTDWTAFKGLGVDLDDLISTVSEILGFWMGQKASMSDQLIVERYVFLLCWSTLSAVTCNPGVSFAQNLNPNPNFSDVKSFLTFSLDLARNRVTFSEETDVPAALLDLLEKLESELSLYSASAKSFTFRDFFAKSSWISLLLSLLSGGFLRHTKMAAAASEGVLFDLGESMVKYVITNKKEGQIVKILSSILETYLQILRDSFLSIKPSCSQDRFFSPLLLLKHTAFDKSSRDLLLSKVGCELSLLETTFSLLPTLDRLITETGTTNGIYIILRSLFHGFPTYPNSPDGSLLSCILSIREILNALEGYIKREERDQLELSVIGRLISFVAAVESDRIFNSISEQCGVVRAGLIGNQDDFQGYNNLFILKQLESFLQSANSDSGFDSEIRELLISCMVDSLNAFRREGPNSNVFKFYLGCDEGLTRQGELDALFGAQRGDVLVLIDALDECRSETVNLKVIGLFADILTGGFCPGLKEKLQKKFLEMELVSLSHWLEVRMLGPTSSSTATTTASPTTVRESTVDFLMRLICPLTDVWAQELQNRLTKALLGLLDTAFLQSDLHTAEAYFHFLVQLSTGAPSFHNLLEKILDLMDRMAGTESLLPGLRFLFMFIESVFGNPGPSKAGTGSSAKKLPSKPSASNNSGSNPASRSMQGENPRNLGAFPGLSRDRGATSADCEGTSGEEDEDEGTSDGELASLDRDEDEDCTSERALASKVCTFTSSGSNFMEQHWYFCYTCDLTISKGCCSVCARVCHRGHRVVYSRSSRFFCDCGAGGVRGSSCQCLKPRKFTGASAGSATLPAASGFAPILSYPEESDPTAESGSDIEDDPLSSENENCFKLTIPKELQDELPAILSSLGVESRLLELCAKLLPSVTCKRDSNLLKDNKVVLGGDKMVSYGNEMFLLRKAYKSGSLDLKIKADYSNSRELKSHLASGSLVKSLLSVSVRGKLAAGEGDKVAIFDVGQLIGQPTATPVTADKINIKPLSRNMVRFEIVHLVFNPLVESYLAVAGYEDCQVLTVNSRGEVTDRLAIELALQGGAYIRRVEWVPGSQVQLMVATNAFVKIYDLSQDNISPVHYFTLANDSITDATLVPASMGKVYLLVLSDLGVLYRLEVSMEGDVGARTLTDVVPVKHTVPQQKSVSLHFSPTYRILFLAYQDGTTLMGRLEANARTLTDVTCVCEEEQDEGKAKPAGLHHWKELVTGSGIFACQSYTKSNVAVTVCLGPHELAVQNMRQGSGSGSALPMVGVAAYKPLSKDKIHCLILYEDGSFHIFSYVGTGTDNNTTGGESVVGSTGEQQARKLGSSILNKAYVGASLEFPIDFFEKTMCITGDVKLSSDAYKGGDLEGIKQRLTSDDGYLESPSSSGFKVTVSNPNPDIVMVGCRIQVGNTSASQIPSEILIFERTVKLDEGIRSWYDIPFTTDESLLSDEEFTLTVGRTFDGLSAPRLDSLEIYGRNKDEFGWKEKMEAVLDLESGGRLGKKGLMAQASVSVQEQVLADALRVLSRVYMVCGSRLDCDMEGFDVEAELSKLKCRDLLETVFGCDRELLLQSAACRVLQAVFPKRETYYHVKDTMRLLGVIKSFPVISSRIGVGGAASSWVIKEFVAQIHTVSKIALYRRSNLATFLEIHGSEVVDGLMDLFWGILDLERPETPTINSIVIPCVELIYSYAECLASLSSEPSGSSVAPAVVLFRKLLFAPYEPVQTSSSLAISSRLLQVPFPKQTMLSATDDAADARGGPSLIPSDPHPNSQLTIEEDPAASSVQYCCDGCSTVPILRRRWHCSVCPDFDLCETCYEILDADRLPLPHSRDHPMTAIPIELDSLSNTDIHFSIADDMNENENEIENENEHPGASLTDADHGNVSEAGEPSADPAMMNQRVVSISASKRAVNSLLLRRLIEELNGWMEGTTGPRTVPVMQLFYRLSSAVGGPFTDSSNHESLDLERFVKWLLIQIEGKKPFPAAKSRSHFGEVSILVFMFFTLMLRNWHQPGSDGSRDSKLDPHDKSFIHVSLSSPPPTSSDDQNKNMFASQLARACSVLRQQSFLDYLMDILQQLVRVFKSPSSVNAESGAASGSGCGSLLTVRRELPAGNFSPFFSDSYAKAHPKDLFADYHKLLLENTFRLVYSMVRPEKHDKSADKDKSHKSTLPGISIGTSINNKDLKLDGYQDVLCNYISNPHTNFVRRYARRLFLHLCGSKTHYYSVRDSWQYSHEVKRLRKIVNKSGGFRNPVPYERSVKLVKCLSALADVAASRPRNWQKYCLKHSDLLPFLIDNLFYFGEESVIQTLKLLNLTFYTGKDSNHVAQKSEEGSSSSKMASSDSKKKRKGEEERESGGSEKSCMDMEQAVETLHERDSTVLRRFIDTFLLEWSSGNVRHEAKCVLYGAWHHGKSLFKESLLTILLQKVRSLPMYGQNIIEYTDLLTWLLGKVADGNDNNNSTKPYEKEIVTKCLSAEAVSSIFETLHSQNELLANHPNSRIYNTLSSLVEFDGYYLESEPCVSCSCPEVPYTRMKLETLKSETKFTDNRIIVKCTGSYTIQSVSMNVHDARRSKSVKVLNLYYNNRPVADLSELKNNWSLWRRARSCHLAANQTELKVEFPIPITACNFMIELDSFYENLQASSLESLQCPRCSRSVTDKHGICSNCHENAYQCRQCRNINYENLDSFLCNECGYSKYGRFEFHFTAKPSFQFDTMENDEDMRKGLAAIESESENAHRRYQQLLGFKKPLVKLVSSIGEHEIDSQHKDTVQQMMISLPGPSCKVNRKIALLGVLYGEKCKAAFDSVSKSVQTLQGLRRVLMNYLSQKNSNEPVLPLSAFANSRSSNSCYGCAATFVTQCLELLQVLSKHAHCKKQLISAGILSELFENNIHQGPRTTRVLARAVLSSFSEGDTDAVTELNGLIKKKVMYCLEHHRSMDVALASREELQLLSETCALVDELWESRLRVAFQLLFSSIKVGAKHPAISENIILPCLRIVSQACTPPRSDASDGKDQGSGKSGGSVLQSSSTSSDKSSEKSQNQNQNLPEGGGARRGQEIPLLSYSEWERGASYLDFVRRQYRVSQAVKGLSTGTKSQKSDYLALKYGLRWKRRSLKKSAGGRGDFAKFALGSWVSELILSACSQSIRSEVCTLINLLFPPNSARQFQLLNLLVSLLPATLTAGESAAEYFELFFNMVESENARIFLTVKGCLGTICKLITKEVSNVESQERSLNTDISQGFILHKLIELLNKFLEVPNIRARFMRDELLSEVLEAFLVIRGLVVQKTKLISDCDRLLKELLDSLVLESTDNKRQFIRACVSGLQKHSMEHKRRSSLFILEQLCNMICPSKPDPVYLLILNKAHTQEEFIRGSMTKNPYSSSEIGPLMRDVKNKICHQLELMGLIEDDYGMELLVAGNIISLDLSVSQVYEQVWRKHHSQAQNALSNAGLPPVPLPRDCPPMTVTYRLQGLDGEATEPMIKELEEEREESQDPEIEFAIAGAVRECGGLEIILSMIQLRDEDLRSNQEELGSVLNLLRYCCKIRENRRALLKLGALGLLLETARRAFSVDAMEPAEGILLIVESLTIEANESDISITQSVSTSSIGENGGSRDQAKKIVLMFIERLCSHFGVKKSNKQQRNDEMVARILPYLTYGEPAAMEALIHHFEPYLTDWVGFDRVQNEHSENPRDEDLAQRALGQRSALENFVRVSESLNSSSCGEGLKGMILERGITKAAVKHLRESFGSVGEEGPVGHMKNRAEWADGLKLPSVPLILSMLRGLSKGHLATQKCIDEEGVLPLLHALEGVVGENEIGAKAENLLDTLANKENDGDGFLGEKINELRHATRDEMRRRALKKREVLLQGLGMRQELGKRIVVSQPAIEGLEDVEEEEEGIACMVCREGYTLRPTDMLGVYSFSKRVNLGATSSTPSGARGDCVYTTVSHFNIIHFQCHQEAKRADAALKNPKKEWEGAALRNNETLCNCIFPLRGPAVPMVQYARCVDLYWENLSVLGRADGSRLRLLTYDIVLMLARFATGASFSADCKGGARESNSRFLPFMVQMACYLLDQGNPNQQRRTMSKSIATYLSNNTSTSSSSSSSPSASLTPGSRLSSSPVPAPEETVQFMMVNSLLSESYEDWVQHRPAFIQRGIYHAYMQHKHSSSTDVTDTDKLFNAVQPMLVYTGLIEQLQRFFKVNKKLAITGEEGGLERWELVMRERMGNMKEMVGCSKDLLFWLEDMSSSADLQEAFDVMGALEDVFSCGFSSCEDFVRAAILSGKN